MNLLTSSTGIPQGNTEKSLGTSAAPSGSPKGLRHSLGNRVCLTSEICVLPQNPHEKSCGWGGWSHG